MVYIVINFREHSSLCMQEVAVGNWQLKHVAGDKESTYKFYRSLHIKPQQTVTVSAK